MLLSCPNFAHALTNVIRTYTGILDCGLVPKPPPKYIFFGGGGGGGGGGALAPPAPPVPPPLCMFSYLNMQLTDSPFFIMHCKYMYI